MSRLGNFHRHRFRDSCLVTTIITVAWLGLAMAPCQAAADAVHPCSSQDGSLPAGDCGDCPPAISDAGQDCVTAVAAECLSPGKAITEVREAGKSQPAALLTEFVNFNALFPGIRSPSGARISPPPVSRVSVQQRYCTYLK